MIIHSRSLVFFMLNFFSNLNSFQMAMCRSQKLYIITTMQFESRVNMNENLLQSCRSSKSSIAGDWDTILITNGAECICYEWKKVYSKGKMFLYNEIDFNLNTLFDLISCWDVNLICIHWLINFIYFHVNSTKLIRLLVKYLGCSCIQSNK